MAAFGKSPSRYAAPASVFAMALVLRFLYIYGLKGDPGSECLVLDPKYYSDWGMRIASGDWLGGSDVFEMTPLYAYFLAFVYKLVSTDLFAVRLIQALIGSLSALLVYAIAMELIGRRLWAFVAGAAAAAYAPFIFYDGMVMKPVLEVFFVLLMALFLIRRASCPVAFPFLAGCCLALAALLRENIILLIPVIPLWIWLTAGPRQARLKSVAAFLAGVILFILPVTIRNYHVSGDIVPITSGGGEVFYIGNNPEADGTYIQPAWVRPTPELEHEDFRRKARELTGRVLTRKEASDFWFGEGLRFIRENPARFAWLLSRKFVLFWNAYELPDNLNYYFQRTVSGVLGLPLPHFGVIAPIGLLGMLLALRERRRYSILYLVFLVYMASVLIFFNFARFRVLAVPFLIVFGAYALSWAESAARARRLVPLAAAAAALALFFAGSNYNVLGRDPYSYKFETAYTNLGNCRAERGDLQGAYDLFRKALEINPRYSSALSGLGNILLQTGDGASAERAFAAAVAENPYAANAFSGLGSVLSARGEHEPAIRALKRAVELEPQNPAYLTNYGYALNARGMYQESAAAFAAALEARPGFADAYWGLALSYENSGRYAEAAGYWGRFIEASADEGWKAKARERLSRLRSLEGAPGR